MPLDKQPCLCDKCLVKWIFYHCQSGVCLHHWSPTKKQKAEKPLTVNQAVAGLQVADDADGGDGEHAAQAEDEAAEAVVDAGDVFPQPGVVEGRHDGERVEADAAQEVDHGQVNAQQLGAHHFLPPAVTDHQNQAVAQNWEQN